MQSWVQTNSNTRPNKFFRSSLLTLSAEEISAIVDRMEKEANELKAQCLKMSWHMRGGSTYEDVLNMSFGERNMIAELIKTNLETTQKSKLPFF